MVEAEEITIQVKRGIKVVVKEVEALEGDRALVALAPAGLKLSIERVEGRLAPASASKITMCG